MNNFARLPTIIPEARFIAATPQVILLWVIIIFFLIIYLFSTDKQPIRQTMRKPHFINILCYFILKLQHKGLERMKKILGDRISEGHVVYGGNNKQLRTNWKVWPIKELASLVENLMITPKNNS